MLPFFPSTTDIGFAPTTYQEVDSTFGNWEDVEAAWKRFRTDSRFHDKPRFGAIGLIKPGDPWTAVIFVMESCEMFGASSSKSKSISMYSRVSGSGGWKGVIVCDFALPMLLLRRPENCVTTLDTYGNLDSYQVNCTYYSELGENDDTYMAAQNLVQVT